MLQNKPQPQPVKHQWVLPLYGLLLVGGLLGWWLLPKAIHPLQALQGEKVITQFETAILNNPVYLRLRPRAPVRYTEQVDAIATDSSQPAAPIELTALDQKIGGVITLEWEAAPGETYDEYTVYRAEVSGGTASVLAEQVQTSTYTDTTAQNGVTYLYNVEGVLEEAVSMRSEVATGTATDSTPPHAPSAVKAKNTADGLSIELRWENPPDQDFVSVRIYRSTVFGLLGTLLVEGQAGEAYVDTQVPANNIPVFYTLTSVDEVGNESPATLRTSLPGNANPFQILYQ